jgi:hypothetical protein
MATERQQKALIVATAAQYMALHEEEVVTADVISYVQDEMQQYDDVKDTIIAETIETLPEDVQEIL